MSKSLIPVTSYDGLMADGRRLTCQSFRSASAAPGSDPTVYFMTLGAAPDATGATTYNLITAGVQGIRHPVKITILDGPVELKLPDGRVETLPIGGTYTLPARGAQQAMELSFVADTCTLKAEPQRGGGAIATKSLDAEVLRSGAAAAGAEGGDGGNPPPPPLPGHDGTT